VAVIFVRFYSVPVGKIRFLEQKSGSPGGTWIVFASAYQNPHAQKLSSQHIA